MNYKKLTAVIFSLIISSAQVYAIDIPGASVLSATIDLTDTGGTPAWNAVIKNVSDNVAATTIVWSSVIPGVTPYKVADQYIEVDTTITTLVNWRMIIYTDNTQYTGDKNAGGFGLVATLDASKGLPLAWKVLESTAAVSTPVFTTSRPEDGNEGFTDFQWKFLGDQNRTGTFSWDATITYVRVWDNDGFYWNEGVGPDMDLDTTGAQPSPAPSIDNKVVIYLAADFTRAFAQAYDTTTLTLEVLLP